MSVDFWERMVYLAAPRPLHTRCVGDHDDATIAFCKSKGITYEAYGALRSVDFTNKQLIAVATVSVPACVHHHSRVHLRDEGV